jgi:uncharacterized protein
VVENAGVRYPFFNGKEDSDMVALAYKENRILLTRDTHLMEWGAIRDGRVHALLIQSDDSDMQISQVALSCGLGTFSNPFSLCLECNQRLAELVESDVRDKVPPYVFQTQNDFRQCPECHRIYWRGTHWKAMMQKLELILRLSQSGTEKP